MLFMKKILYNSSCTLLFIFLSCSLWSQYLDPSFGTSGKAGPFTNDFFPVGIADRIQSVQTMTVNNGKIWIAGHKYGGANQDLAVMRLNADGTPDATYGTNGVQTFANLGGDEYATAIAYSSSLNAFVITGYRKVIVSNQVLSDIVIMFLNPDGSVNNNLGQGGVTIVDIAPYEEVYSIAFGTGSGINGIFLGGYTTPFQGDETDARGRVYRLNNRGDFESSFVVDYAGATCHVFSLAIDSYGILAGGDNNAGGRFVVARYSQDGSLDNSFDGDGKVFVDVGNSPAGVTQILVQPDGKILLTGAFFNVVAGFNGSVVARLNSNGAVDNNFSGGYSIVPFDYSGNLGAPRSMVLQSDGKIIVSGIIRGTTAPDIDFGLARLNSDGTLDNGFGTSGFYRFGFTNGSIDVSNSLQLVDGKLYVGTMSKADNSVLFSTAMIRLQFTPPSCPDADNDGYTTCNGDCNDNNAAIHPGAAEVCNGIDDDCDGSIDEGLQFSMYYTDADGDSYGDKNDVGVSSCSPVAGKVTNNSDCNDANAAVHPGATELCNGIDDNCSGTTDEGCSVTPSVTINSVTVTEASGVAHLTVSLSSVSTLPVKVNYKTIDGTAQSKMKNKDFKAVTNGSVTIPAGSSSAQFPISIIADNIPEADEQFSVQLTKANGAELGTPATGTVTITEGVANISTTKAQYIDASGGETVNNLQVHVYSNPTHNSFRVQVSSNDKKERIYMQVIDVNGRVVETRGNIINGAVLQLGDKYRKGIYFLRVMQGRHYKEVRLEKISD